MDSQQNKVTGVSGQALAEEFLQREQYSIIARNFRIRQGEIDIVARDGDTICFVEVKARNSLAAGLPEESVSKSKQQRMNRAALIYLQDQQMLGVKARFDVVAIEFPQGAEPLVRLYKNAFDATGDY